MMSLSININHDNLNEVPTGEPPLSILSSTCKGWIAKVLSSLHEFLRPLRWKIELWYDLEMRFRFCMPLWKYCGKKIG